MILMMQETASTFYVSVEELSEAMMLGDQTEMVVSQGRDVSHNHKEGQP